MAARNSDRVSVRWGAMVLAVAVGGCGAGSSTASGAQTTTPENVAADDEEGNGAPDAKTAEHYLVREEVIPHGDAGSEVRIYAQDETVGPYVTIVPSLGRGVDDYTEMFQSTITTRLVEAGFRVLLIQPRGVGNGYGDLLTPDVVTMQMLVDDLKLTLDALKVDRLHVVGHGFGNRVARSFAASHKQQVDGLALLAPGANVEMSSEAERCVKGSFDMALAAGERLQDIGCAFFTKGHDPTVWLWGWYPDLARAQMHASESADPSSYKDAGGKTFLLVQAKDDFIAPPDKAGRALKAELGDQVTYVEIADAGRALTSEQPDEVAKQLIEYFTKAEP